MLQSLDPLPMQGPELGFHADDIERPDMEQDSKQEVLENKDVRFLGGSQNRIDSSCDLIHKNFCVVECKSYLFIVGGQC